MSSFVKKKANTQWLWIAMDTQSRQVLPFTWGIAAARVPSDCGEDS